MIFIPISSVLIKLRNLDLIKCSFNFQERLQYQVGKETEPREKQCIYADTGASPFDARTTCEKGEVRYNSTSENIIR